jgi:hypothetical protein
VDTLLMNKLWQKEREREREQLTSVTTKDQLSSKMIVTKWFKLLKDSCDAYCNEKCRDDEHDCRI